MQHRDLPVAEALAPFMGHHQYGVLAREVNGSATESAPVQEDGRPEGRDVATYWREREAQERGLQERDEQAGD